MSTPNSTTQAAADAATEPRVDQSASAIEGSVKLFDRTNHFTRKILDPTTDTGRKTCLVRFPTDDEWCQRSKQIVSIRKSLDGGRSKTETPREAEVNERLFEKIRLDADNGAGAKFDGAEAQRIVETLERCTPISCERVGVQYTIVMKTFNGCEVTHVLKMPSQKQLMDFGRATIQIQQIRQILETRVALEPSRDLWKALKVSVTGYTSTSDDSGVPIIHMTAAINELLAQVNADADALDIDPED